MKVWPSPNDANHYIVTGLDPKEAKYLMGCKKRKDGSYLVEANYLNMHQLNIPFKIVSEGGDDEALHPHLFDYQKADTRRMVRQKHIFNANRMGYGKTIEAIATLRALKVKRALILAPKAVLYQWVKELRTWWPEAENERTVAVRPDAKTVADITITNYEALQNPQLLTRLKSRTWDVLVCDESHRIKSRKSKRWEYVMNLPALRKICLSGTPILRRVDDLWAQWQWLNWRYSGLSYWTFVEFFCETSPNPHAPNQPDIGSLQEDPRKVELLNWLVDLVCIRNPNMHLSVGKLSHTVDIKLEKDSAQRKLYMQARELAFDTLPEKLTITNGMSHLLRLRQITSCPQQFDAKCGNAKFEWIKDTIEDNPDMKFVVYSCWATTILHLQKFLGPKCLVYIGDNAGKDNEEAKELFLTHPKAQVLAGTIGALGTGVDGLQKVCHTAIFIDRDWSPEINNQAEDRLDRYPQQELCHNYYLECVGTMDRHVTRINLSKAEDIKEALHDEP